MSRILDPQHVFYNWLVDGFPYDAWWSVDPENYKPSEIRAYGLESTKFNHLRYALGWTTDPRGNFRSMDFTISLGIAAERDNKAIKVRTV